MRFRAALLLTSLLLGCQRPPSHPAVETPRPTGAVEDPTPLEAPGLHNVFHVSGRVYSGSAPEGEAGFAALAGLGVKTIISVDGAAPDVEAAQRHGLMYVHVPFGYDGIPRDRVLTLAKAASQLPGPIYLHCHHGKHRGPAAVAVILLCTDPAWDADRAEAWLKAAGTDSRYSGLVGLPRSFARPTAEELARAPAEFPSVASVTDLARLMVEVDAKWDALKLVKAAGWTAPKDHSDIDPPHEALQLVEHYREAGRLDAVGRRGPGFTKLLGDAEAAAATLERELRAAPVDAVRVGRAFDGAGAACVACHQRYRDRRVDR
jgi:protein tyrosine phosphatase (PTP) superfamily phosphohydrolase (DUF442 family)